MSAFKTLIVDDEDSLRLALSRVMSLKGYQPLLAGTLQEAKEIMQQHPDIDLALVDLRLPDGDGVSFMQDLKSIIPDCEVIILTGFASLDTAIQAIKKGAFHFATKPFNIDEITAMVEKALSQKRLQKENLQLKKELHRKYDFHNIVGQSEGIQKVLGLVERVADSDSTILITGESGTGKELIAKAIHYNSTRSQKPFIPINCGAIPPELLESELFGHVKGAFTGAINNRAGRFELANGGTLFLDEIGDLNLSLQVKLLRVLQERRFEPVGSVRTFDADVRIIAATNIKLEQAVREGKFREDLYYRLNVIPITVPALRDRRQDIPILLQHFIEKANSQKNRRLQGIQRDALECLINYRWPGNIRELENLVERVAILKGQGLIQINDLPEYFAQNSEAPRQELSFDIGDLGVDFNTAVDAYENALILKALEKTGWNRNQAATLLKLNRTTLVEKIKKKGLRPPEIEI